MRTKLILICDTKNEIDDQFAIAYALNSPEIELLGVVSTQNIKRNGTNSVDIYQEEAVKILKLADSKVPAFKGARRLFDENNPEKSEGIDFIIKTALTYPLPTTHYKLIIACTGPVTDIANAVTIEPKIIEKVSFISLSGHKKNWFSRFSQMESNFNADRAASKIIRRLPLDITFIPTLGVTHLIISNTVRLERKLRANNSPLNKYLAELIVWNRRRVARSKPYLIPLLGLWIMSDIAAIAVVKNIGIKKTVTHRHRIITSLSPKAILTDFYRSLSL